MILGDAKGLKELDKENSALKKVLAETMLENRVFKDVNAKTGKTFAQEEKKPLLGAKDL